MASFYENQPIDNRQGNYYVSIVDSGRSSLLAGPYPTHLGALLRVDAVRKLAHKLDQKSWFYGFGTVRVDTQHSKPGRLNDLLEA